jgi:hypothetical protein
MTEIAAWIAFPLVALVVCLGSGLLAERLAGVTLPPAVVPALGFATAIVALGPAYALGGRGAVAVAVLTVTTGAGLWLARSELRRRFRPGFGAAAGGSAYALYIAPVALSGHATFLGYNFLNDTSIHLLLVDYLNELGNRDPSSLAPSSFVSAAEGYVGKSYPLGSHQLLAGLRALLGTEPARLYQPYLAFATGLSAAALFALVRGVGAPGPAAAAAALVAVAGQLLFSFNLQGGIKELTFVTAMAAAAAVGAQLLESARPVRLAALLALPALAAYAIYGLAALAWLGPLAVLLVAGAFVGRPRPVLRDRLLPAVLAAAGVFVVLGLPAIVGSAEFYREGRGTLTSESELGPLIGPIRTAQAAGIWLRGDYRFVPDHELPTYLLIAVALALAALGAALVLRRRAPGPLLFLLPSLAAWLAVSPSGSPYVDAKLLAVLSPAVLLLACAGVGALWDGRTRALAGGAALLLAGGVAVSDALAYRVATLAPVDRLDELTRIGERFDGQGALLVNEFEEYAKHFARHARPFTVYEAWTPLGAQLRDPARPVYAHAYTLDELTLGFVTRFRLIALRRSPAESRPPVGYARVWRGRFYEVWRRTGAVEASAHVPFGFPREDPVSAASVPPCARLRRLARSGDLVAALRPEGVAFDFAANPDLPPGWRLKPDSPMTFLASFGGSVAAEARTGAGRHRVWLKGRVYRDDRVFIDGRPLGVVRHVNGPNQWIDAGTIDLQAGGHRAELRRPTGSLAPSDAQADELGPLVVVPEQPARLVRVRGRDAGRLCGRPLDWVERLGRR